MQSADQQAGDIHGSMPHWHGQQVRNWIAPAVARIRPLLDFWTKLNNDWVFNLSGLLAYNFLMSLFPILLVLLAGVGFFLGDQGPDTLAAMEQAIERFVPGGGIVFEAVSVQLANSAGLLLLIGVGSSLFAGSRLFVVLENCFGIIFRVRGRDFIEQNVMAFGMLLLYLMLVSVIMLGSTLPITVLPMFEQIFRTSPRTVTVALTYITSLAAALLLVCAVYAVVPNRRMRSREVWPGALLATTLLVLYELLFPRFVTLLFHPDNYGAIAAFAIIILLFFYYLGFILLLGAEVNAWIAGQRSSTGDIAASMHDIRFQSESRTPDQTSLPA